MLFWFKTLYGTQLKRISLGILLAFIAALSGVSLLMLSGWFITATALAGISITAGLVIIFDMYMPGSGIRFFALSRTLGRYAERLYNHDTILRLVAVYRLRLFKQLTQFSFEDLRKTSDSEWLSRLTADLDALDSLLLRFTITPIVIVLLIFCATVFSYLVWPEYAIVIGVYLLACALGITVFTIKNTKDLSRKNASLLNVMREQIIEHLQGRFELQSRLISQQHERHCQASLEELEEVQSALNSRVANIQLILDFLLMAGTCSLVIVGLFGVNSGQINGPIAVMAVLMFVAISELLQVIPTQYEKWGSTAYSAERLSHKALNSETAKPNKIVLRDNDAITLAIHHHPLIAASRLKPLTFTINGTQTLVISGQSGAGKSTLANILAGIASSENSGKGTCSIVINSAQHTQKIPDEFSWDSIAYLMQANSILAGSVAYNLRLGLENIDDDTLWSTLKLVELDGWAQSLSDGLYTWLGETGSQLSGGQSRRLALARLLLRNPQLVILDEPFNGLDEGMAQRIWRNISPWLDKRKVILLSHEFPHKLLPETNYNHLQLSD